MLEGKMTGQQVPNEGKQGIALFAVMVIILLIGLLSMFWQK